MVIQRSRVSRLMAGALLSAVAVGTVAAVDTSALAETRHTDGTVTTHTQPKTNDDVDVTPWGEPPSFHGTARLLVSTMRTVTGATTRATTVLFKPKGAAPKGGWPVVAWAHGTTTPGNRNCAPSLTPDDLDGGLTRDGFASSYAFEIGSFVNRGYAVAAPDFEGLGPDATTPYPYFNATSLARSLVDSVIAARKVDRSLSDRFVAVGHSDGGHAVLGVEAAARRHPGLHFLGTAALAPYTSIRPLVSDFAKQGRTGRGVAASVGTTNAQFNVALMATGLSAVDPRWNPATIMGKDLRALLPKFKTLCSVEAVELVGKAIAAAHGSFSGYKADWASNPRMKAFLAHNDPAAEPGFDLKKPTLVEQGTADTFVLKSLTTALVHKLRRRGDKVSYRVWSGDDHFAVIKDSNSDVLSFLRQRFGR